MLTMKCKYIFVCTCLLDAELHGSSALEQGHQGREGDGPYAGPPGGPARQWSLLLALLLLLKLSNSFLKWICSWTLPVCEAVLFLPGITYKRTYRAYGNYATSNKVDEIGIHFQGKCKWPYINNTMQTYQYLILSIVILYNAYIQYVAYIHTIHHGYQNTILISLQPIKYFLLTEKQKETIHIPQCCFVVVYIL